MASGQRCASLQHLHRAGRNHFLAVLVKFWYPLIFKILLSLYVGFCLDSLGPALPHTGSLPSPFSHSHTHLTTLVLTFNAPQETGSKKYFTNSRSSLRLTSIESLMPSSHLILCRGHLKQPGQHLELVRNSYLQLLDKNVFLDKTHRQFLRFTDGYEAQPRRFESVGQIEKFGPRSLGFAYTLTSFNMKDI